MTNRLSFWIAVAAAIPCGFALYVVGFSWLVFLAALQVPAVLATLLLGRATWRAVRGQPWALRVGAREVLAGLGGFAAPILFLVAWTAVREAGVVTLEMRRTETEFTRTSKSMGWQSEAPDGSLADGLAVHAPAGVLGDAFAGQLRGDWSAADSSRLHGDVTLDFEPPFAGWPFYKSATVNCRIAARLQLRAHDAPDATRGSTATIHIEGTWTMVGAASRHDFHSWLGKELAQFARKDIDDLVRKADAK